MIKISKTKLTEKVLQSKNCITLGFIKNDGKTRVITGSVKSTDLTLGYILFEEAISNKLKRVDCRTLIGGIIEGDQYNVK
jgi:hypothetical protein